MYVIPIMVLIPIYLAKHIDKLLSKDDLLVTRECQVPVKSDVIEIQWSCKKEPQLAGHYINPFRIVYKLPSAMM